jgi:ketosteroid isomerase-like protein
MLLPTFSVLNSQDMTGNAELITQFYRAFQARDFTTMQACYADDATFSDPVFTDLNADQVRAMWEMFCKRGTDLNITFSKVAETPTGATAHWIARYTFSATGRKVVNHIQAEFTIRDGKIVAHRDTFNFYSWLRQALGLKGLLLGWTSFMKHKVRSSAMYSLNQFIIKSK